MCWAVLSHSVMSDSLQSHGPVRLLCPRNSPGKNTGVGCHALLQGFFPTQGLNPGPPHCRQTLYPLSHQGYSPWSSPGQNTGVGCHALLQGFFPTQRLKPGLLYCMQILYHMSHLITFKILFCLLRSLITVCLGVNSFNLIMCGIHPPSCICELIQFSSVAL